MNLILKMFYWVYGFSNIHLIFLIVSAPLIWEIICWFALEIGKMSLKRWRALCAVLLIFCVCAILYVTIGMRVSGERILALTPFYSIVGVSSGAIQSILLNVMMFEPIGMLLPYVFYKGPYLYINIWKEIVLCILFSVILEMIQYVFRLGTVETDDVIFNTLGYVIGRRTTHNLVIIKKNQRKDKAFQVDRI